MHFVRQDCLFCQQAGTVVYVDVMLAFGEQLLYPRDLGLVLAYVGLHRKSGVFMQLTQSCEAVTCAAGGEPWRNNRADNLVFWVYLLDVVDSRLCLRNDLVDALVLVIIGCVLVHTDAANEGSLTLLQTYVCQQVGGINVDSGVVSCSRGSMRESPGDCAVVYLPRLFDVCIR